jgi:hypothetical protein
MKVYLNIIMLLLMSIDARRLRRNFARMGPVLFRIILKNIVVSENNSNKLMPFEEVNNNEKLKAKYLKDRFNGEGVLLNNNPISGSNEEFKGELKDFNPFEQKFKIVPTNLVTEFPTFKKNECSISADCIQFYESLNKKDEQAESISFRYLFGSYDFLILIYPYLKERTTVMNYDGMIKRCIEKPCSHVDLKGAKILQIS